MFENELNVNDILRYDLMPTYFVINSENEDMGNLNVTQNVLPPVNGSMDAALSMLDYHR